MNSEHEAPQEPPGPDRAESRATRVSPTELLRAHPIFGQLPTDVTAQLGTYATRRRVKRGAVIFAKGDPGTGLMALLEGAVRISMPTQDGREVVLNLVQPGEIFGEIALLDGQPRTADAIAAEDCDLMVIDRRNFIPFVHGRPEVAVNLIEILCGRLRRTNEQVQDVMFLSLPARLAKLILRLAKGDHASVKKLAITQQELSQMIGMSREATNKQLRAWEKRQLLRLDHRTITVLNEAALARAGEDDADAG
jgi:CRP/FNR family transcriptional regulator, cyclic AMP receptor protein